MAIELTMPALSPTMEKGTLARWLVKVGDPVRPGDVMAEIETDKATLEYEATDAGTVASIAVAGGTEDVPIGTVIATILAAGETLPSPVLATPVLATPVPVPAPAALTPTRAIVTPADVVAPVPATTASPDNVGAINATPLARRIATINGKALQGIAGSGPRGRIVKADLGLPSLLAAHQPLQPNTLAGAAAAVVYDPPAGVPVDTVKLTTMRKAIARRLSESKQTIPHFYLTVRCNLDALNRLRGELNGGLAARGIKLSVNDMLVKAMALAMIAVPDVNVQFGGDVLHRFARADIAMAVAIDGGLVTPVIRDVGALSLSAIAQASKALAGKARDGRLVPEDYQGGTASISNLGMFGIDQMFPVINPPQAMILGVAAGIEQPWKVEGAIALATVMAATASFDHRAIDGAAAAQFLAIFQGLVENPLQLVC